MKYPVEHFSPLKLAEATDQARKAYNELVALERVASRPLDRAPAEVRQLIKDLSDEAGERASQKLGYGEGR